MVDQILNFEQFKRTRLSGNKQLLVLQSRAEVNNLLKKYHINEQSMQLFKVGHFFLTL